MLGTTRTGLRFFCPECGTGLRAPRADAGTALDCHCCGALVRVPRSPHPRESDADEAPLIPPAASSAAHGGIRLLSASLGLYAISVGLAVVVVAVWAAISGPAQVLDREPGELRVPLAITALLEMFLTCTGAGLRWVGYGRCLPAASAVRATGWIGVARAGVVIAALGAVVAVGPGLAGIVLGDVPTAVKSLGRFGQFTRLVGGTVELGVLFVWARVLTEAGGRAATRQVMQYAAAVVGATAATVSVFCLVGMITVLSLRKDGHFRPDPFTDGTPAAVPPEGWYVLATAVSVAAGFALLLSWQYYHILIATRSALSGPDNPSSRPVAA